MLLQFGGAAGFWESRQCGDALWLALPCRFGKQSSFRSSERIFSRVLLPSPAFPLPFLQLSGFSGCWCRTARDGASRGEGRAPQARYHPDLRALVPMGCREASGLDPHTKWVLGALQPPSPFLWSQLSPGLDLSISWGWEPASGPSPEQTPRFGYGVPTSELSPAPATAFTRCCSALPTGCGPCTPARDGA